MKTILTLLAFVSLSCYGQKSGYTNIGAQINSKNDAGGSIGVGFKKDRVSIGANIEAIKLNSSKGIYLPISVNPRFYFTEGDMQPFFSLNAGYAYYRQTVSQTNVSHSTTVSGGFYSGVGLGMNIAAQKKTGLYIIASYKRLPLTISSSYQSSPTSSTTGIRGVIAIDFGLRF